MDRRAKARLLRVQRHFSSHTVERKHSASVPSVPSGRQLQGSQRSSVAACGCIGEQMHVAPDTSTSSRAQGSRRSMFKYQFQRKPLKIVFTQQESYKESYGGASGVVILEGELLEPSNSPYTSTVLIFMHPSAVMNLLPLPRAMARAGVHVITCASRYANNDSTTLMEKVAIDLSHCVRHARDVLGYKKVVLAGWSGGGSLSAFYQSQAESPTVSQTPSGIPVDLSDIPPADGLMLLAAHSSRARILTEWLDPSVVDEKQPFLRDPTLDLYDPRNKPPFSAAFVKKFREAQVARNRRITAWVRQELRELKNHKGWVDRAFVVHNTMADPRWLDPALEPNDRLPGTCFMGDPQVANNVPKGLARFCTLHSWLSQWSFDDSEADALKHLPRVKAPVLVVANSADNAVPPSHPTAMFEAVAHSDKEMYTIQGATHYYLGQNKHLGQCCRIVLKWLSDHSLLPK